MNIDHVEIMRRVAEIAPKLAEYAVASDEARQVVAENMRAMIAAGIFRIPQPARVSFPFFAPSIIVSLLVLSRGQTVSYPT